MEIRLELGYAPTGGRLQREAGRVNRDFAAIERGRGNRKALSGNGRCKSFARLKHGGGAVGGLVGIDSHVEPNSQSFVGGVDELAHLVGRLKGPAHYRNVLA